MSLIPLVSILFIVALVAALVWFVERRDAAGARTKLATDALWVDQTLRFQLGVDEDMLARLALDAAGGVADTTLDARARLHIANNPEMLSVVWHDATGRPLRALPGLGAPRDAALVDLILRSGVDSTRPVYGGVRGGTVTMGLRLPEGAGVVTATISLALVLERHVPWWIAEQYAVHLADAGGAVIATRAQRTPDPAHPAHTISFDPPLAGTVLTITSYAPSSARASTLILAAIAGLAGFAVLALLALYGNSRRRRAAERQLQEEMAFRRSMEDSLTVGLRAKDQDGRILYVNPAFAALVGWPAEALVGHRPPMPYWAPDRVDETLERQRRLAAGGARAQSFETRFRRSDGTEIDVQVYEAPLIDARGVHRGWMGSVIDITAARDAARLARAQDENMTRTGRLVTLGEMASTLAHELNQPLSAIASYAAGMQNLLAAGKSDPAVLAPATDRIAQQASRAGEIIRRIQDLVKKREPRLDPLDLTEVVTETIGFLAADARENRVRIVTDLATVPPVAADRILIEQVLINLIRNGMEAMAEGRRHADVLRLSLAPTPEGGARIDVTDAGQGIDPAVADRLFDAFTSTKPQGMGMGLNICRSIVELHRGQLVHAAGVPHGTVFSVILPGAPEATQEAAE